MAGWPRGGFVALGWLCQGTHLSWHACTPRGPHALTFWYFSKIKVTYICYHVTQEFSSSLPSTITSLSPSPLAACLIIYHPTLSQNLIACAFLSLVLLYLSHLFYWVNTIIWENNKINKEQLCCVNVSACQFPSFWIETDLVHGIN